MKRKLGMAVATAAIASLTLTAGAGAADNGGPVTMTPANVDFGSQAVGSTSSARTVTLDVPCLYVLDLGQYGGRSCSAPGNIGWIDMEGPFTQTNDCVLPINNSSIDGTVVSCTITVRFSPTANGPAEGAIQLASYGAANQYTVPLTGTGFTPAPPPENNNGNGGGSKDKAGEGNGIGGAAGVTGKKCAKKAKKGAKKAKKCGKKKARR